MSRMTHQRRCRRTMHPSSTGPSLGHSAHIGQEVVVHYRWHPLHGRRLRRHYGERRSGDDVVHVEAAPGIVMVVAAWMLDPMPVRAWRSARPALRPVRWPTCIAC